MRRGNPQTTNIHMTQHVTTKVAPAYDGRTSFFAFEDAIDDWCDITELEAEKRCPALRNRLEGDAAQYKRLLDRERLRDPNEGCELPQKIPTTSFHEGCANCFLAQVHAVHETQKRYYGLATMDDQISTYCRQTHWVFDGFDTWFGPYGSRCDCSNCSTPNSSWRTTAKSGRNCTSYSWCLTTCCRTLEWWDVQTSTCTTGKLCKRDVGL